MKPVVFWFTFKYGLTDCSSRSCRAIQNVFCLFFCCSWFLFKVYQGNCSKTSERCVSPRPSEICFPSFIVYIALHSRKSRGAGLFSPSLCVVCYLFVLLFLQLSLVAVCWNANECVVDENIMWPVATPQDLAWNGGIAQTYSLILLQRSSFLHGEIDMYSLRDSRRLDSASVCVRVLLAYDIDVCMRQRPVHTTVEMQLIKLHSTATLIHSIFHKVVDTYCLISLHEVWV